MFVNVADDMKVVCVHGMEPPIHGWASPLNGVFGFISTEIKMSNRMKLWRFQANGYCPIADINARFWQKITGTFC
jgi:hypothetical protein